MPALATFFALALATGAGVGFVLGLIGGGGSILAVPALVYVVGVPSIHAAIGTSAIAVAVNAAGSLALRARDGAIKWRCAVTFAAAGVVGALIGAELGKALDGQKLLALFGLVMIAVGASMLLPQKHPSRDDVRLTRASARVLAPRLDRKSTRLNSSH